MRAAPTDPLKLTLEEALLSHRLSSVEGDDGEAFQLVDALSFNGPTIARGQREIALLAESLADAVRGAPAVARDDAAELRAALEAACERLELILTAHERGFGRDYIESCAVVGVDKARAALAASEGQP